MNRNTEHIAAYLVLEIPLSQMICPISSRVLAHTQGHLVTVNTAFNMDNSAS